MIYSLQKTSSCDLTFSTPYNVNGVITVPSGIPGATFVNSITVEYFNSCESPVDNTYEAEFIPLPLLVDFELTCQDVLGVANYTLAISTNPGPLVPVGTEFVWNIKRSNAIIQSYDLGTVTSTATWTATFYQANDVIELNMTLPNGVVVKIVKTVTSVTPGAPCYAHALGQAVSYIDYTGQDYTFANNTFTFPKPVDGVYTYKLTINYNTDTETGLEIEEEECQFIHCTTECDTAKYTAEELCSDLYLFFRAVDSAIRCQRCEDACTIFEYLNEKLNETDCHCNEPTIDCC